MPLKSFSVARRDGGGHYGVDGREGVAGEEARGEGSEGGHPRRPHRLRVCRPAGHGGQGGCDGRPPRVAAGPDQGAQAGDAVGVVIRPERNGRGGHRLGCGEERRVGDGSRQRRRLCSRCRPRLACLPPPQAGREGLKVR